MKKHIMDAHQGYNYYFLDSATASSPKNLSLPSCSFLSYTPPPQECLQKNIFNIIDISIVKEVFITCQII
jgi:hypothetical protein